MPRPPSQHMCMFTYLDAPPASSFQSFKLNFRYIDMIDEFIGHMSKLNFQSLAPPQRLGWNRKFQLCNQIGFSGAQSPS